MKIDDPGQILVQVENLLLAQQKLMNNRTLINRVFNGEAPYTPEEQLEENIATNVNYLAGTRIASNSTNQINNAFFKPGHFFKVSIDKGPMRLRSYWSNVVTAEINKQLKRSRHYRAARESAHAQVVLHGPGPLAWRNRRTPVPSAVGIEDVLIPSGTTCDMANLDRFALYRELTWNQLHDAAFGKVVDKGWNKAYMGALCSTLYHTGYEPIYQGNRWLFPEKLAEDYKEGAAYTFSSSLPKVLAWDFFYRNEDTGKWNRRMVLDYGNMGPTENKDGKPLDWDKADVSKQRELLYSMDDYAEDWSEILHWYIGNCSNVAPYRYHSIRSIGYLLFGVVMLDNKFRNRMMDHSFTQLLYLMRNISDDNREKLGMIDLQNYGVVPDGVSFISAAERFECDPGLLMMVLNQNRQLMAESSSAFLPDLPGDPNASKEMTATETLVRQNTSITLTSAVLNQLGDQSLYEYREIARRFAMRDNPDPMAKAFRAAIQKQGVPLEMLDFETWDVMPEMSKGGGSKAMELTVGQAMMREVFPLVDPQAQRTILRDYVSALTDNPDEAMMLVPEQQEQGGPDVQVAQVAFSVLMDGVQFQPPRGADPVVLASVLMQMAGVPLNQAQAAMQQPSGLGMASEKLAGAANVLQFVQGAIDQVGQAASVMESRKVVAKQLQQQHDLLMGELQQLAKAVMEAEQQMQPQVDGEQAKLQAKLQDIQATGELKRQLAGAQAEQKREQQQAKWGEENARRNADTQAEIERGNARTTVELRNSLVKAHAEGEIAKMKEAKKPAPVGAAK